MIDKLEQSLIIEKKERQHTSREVQQILDKEATTLAQLLDEETKQSDAAHQ